LHRASSNRRVKSDREVSISVEPLSLKMSMMGAQHRGAIVSAARALNDKTSGWMRALSFSSSAKLRYFFSLTGSIRGVIFQGPVRVVRPAS